MFHSPIPPGVSSLATSIAMFLQSAVLWVEVPKPLLKEFSSSILTHSGNYIISKVALQMWARDGQTPQPLECQIEVADILSKAFRSSNNLNSSKLLGVPQQLVQNLLGGDEHILICQNPILEI